MQSLKELIEGAFFHSWQRTSMVLGGLILALALPITIILTQQQQDLRQRASEDCTRRFVMVGGTMRYLCIANENPAPVAPIATPVPLDKIVIPGIGTDENTGGVGGQTNSCATNNNLGGCGGGQVCCQGGKCAVAGSCQDQSCPQGFSSLCGKCCPALKDSTGKTIGLTVCTAGIGGQYQCIDPNACVMGFNCFDSKGQTCKNNICVTTCTMGKNCFAPNSCIGDVCSSPCAPSSNKPLNCSCDNSSQCSSGYCGDGGGEQQANKKCTVAPTATKTPTPTPTKTPTPTNTPTLTPAPTTSISTTPSPTLTQTPQNTTLIALTVSLPGIGSNAPVAGLGPLSNNETPKRNPREVEVLLGNSEGENVTSLVSGSLTPVSGTLTFDPASFTYKGVISLASLPTANYQVFIRLDNSLYKAATGYPLLTLGQTTQIPAMKLISGDIDRSGASENDMTIDDYNLFMACFKEREICTPQAKIRADLDDNEIIDTIDLHLMLRGFANREGDSPI